MSCGSPHLDIFKDTTEEDVGTSLEIDRIKEKVRSVWNQLIKAQYEKEYKYQNDEDESRVSIEEYMEKHQLLFPGDEKPESEVENLLTMLEDLLNPQESLHPVK
jgi:hypothetical protein